MDKSRPLRVLVFAHSSELGGANKSMQAMLTHLDRNRFHLAAVLPRNGTAREAFASLGVRTKVIGTSPGYTKATIPLLRRAIHQYDCDLVYGNSFCGGTRNVCIAAMLTRVPFVWHVHEVLQPGTKFRNHFFLRFAKRIVAVSKASVSSMHQFLPRNRDVQLIFNSIDSDHFSVTGGLRKQARNELCTEFAIPSDARIILTLGQITDRKGQDYLLETASLVTAQVPSAVFLVVGSTMPQDIAFFEHLVEMRTRLSLETQVLFIEFRSNVLPLLRGADLLVHTARNEPFGLVVAEALAVETPVVAFDVGGVGEIVKDGVSGCLVPPFDVEKLAAKTISLLVNEALRKQMGVLGRQSVMKQFSVRNYVGQMQQLLEEAGNLRLPR